MSSRKDSARTTEEVASTKPSKNASKAFGKPSSESKKKKRLHERINKLYNRINYLEESLRKASDYALRAKIKRESTRLREELKSLLPRATTDRVGTVHGFAEKAIPPGNSPDEMRKIQARNAAYLERFRKLTEQGIVVKSSKEKRHWWAEED